MKPSSFWITLYTDINIVSWFSQNKLKINQKKKIKTSLFNNFINLQITVLVLPSVLTLLKTVRACFPVGDTALSPNLCDKTSSGSSQVISSLTLKMKK